VDGTATIESIREDGDTRWVRTTLPSALAPFVVRKGSIALDGISLTVAALHAAAFDVAIIPHTLENTNLQRARAGDIVNLEFDVIAKYVERMLQRENG